MIYINFVNDFILTSLFKKHTYSVYNVSGTTALSAYGY